uniref:F-box/kelch-repeat protein At3g06240-like n=1 Tax=Cicer arietinum TaxID=3827 RepID=A0A3Q7YFU0_CICAR|nr:F-box/kelch-repeat protein At3g06240-like [Cicer arietinum]
MLSMGWFLLNFHSLGKSPVLIGSTQSDIVGGTATALAPTLSQFCLHLFFCSLNTRSNHNISLVNKFTVTSRDGKRCECDKRKDNFGDNFDDVIIDLPDPFKDEHPSIRVLDSGSITGILCLYTIGDLRYALWNPTTEEFKIIPQLPREFDSPYITEEVIPLGFGFDQVRNDFKLITNVLFCLQYEDIDYPEFSCEYRIYNLKSNSWRKIDKDVGFISSFYTETCQRLYMNGMCHWWVFSHDGRDITSFDLVTEEIITTHIPLEIHPDVNDDFNVAYIPLSLMVLNGSIGFISGPLDNTTFNIYILGEIGATESWTKLFTIGPLSDIRLSIGAGKKGDLFFQKEDGDIVRFNLTTQLIEELDIEGDNYSILIYKKSFQSLI